MVWTDERIDKLKKFWSEGLSASQIAVQLGGVTRNAVIGKLHRLLLSNRVKATGNKQYEDDSKSVATETDSRKIRQSPEMCIREPVLKERLPNASTKRKSKTLEKNNVASSGVVLPISRCLRLMELTENTCKWPLGDPFGKDFSFCGSDVHNDSPYCDYHKKLAYQRVHDRRKIQANSQ
ncbi:GcrA family cell cycle regulator [Candidatus Liberibacter brunswickensis]|uniref:GcrA family cell cycle regulator n=1 Tax=Candidatus Liberibacter brunswickensis TaxID=1968796 RepID=UPI002FE1FA5B